MIKGTRVVVTDNSGALEAEIFGIRGGSKRLKCAIGDIVKIAIKKAIPRGKVKKGDVKLAVIVRTKNPVRRRDGSYVKAIDNAIILLNDDFTLVGTRIFGVVARESFANSAVDTIKKIGSICEEVY